ncbi:MAG: hypothetical protein GXO22_07255 [Aquificae bacterium]|nr:hypothetical protein [Aquificota bacterium]
MAKKTENQSEKNLITTDAQLDDNIETTLTQLKDRSVEKTETLEDRLSELKKAFRGKSISNYKVVIYYNDQFLETVPAVDVDFEDIESWLKNRYGGGSFAVEVRKNGAIFIHRNYMRFNILGQPKIKTEQNNASGDPVYSLLGETLSKVVNKIEQLENKISGNNDTNYMISFMQLMMEQNKANQQMMLELLKLNQQQPHREKSFIEKLFEQLTIDKIMLLGSSVYPAIKEFFSNLSGGSLLKDLAPVLEKNPNLLEKVIAKELGINEGNILDTILSDPQLLTKTLEVINGIIARPQVVVKNPALPEKVSVKPIKTEVEKDIQMVSDTNTNKGETDMLIKMIENQIGNIFNKLFVIKQGLENGEFENIAVAVDYVFAPAEIDMFIGYMEQFNINTADDLLNTLNQFGINLESEINQIGKELLNDVIKYLNGEEQEEEKDE